MRRAACAVIAALPPAALCQGPGRGISKSTYAVSDAKASGDWLMKYLPCSEASDDCPNRECTCGTQGRVALTGSSFGVHTVWAPGDGNHRADANGGKTLQEIEKIWDDGIGDLSKTYDSDANARGWCDNSLAMYTTGSLDSYVTAFDAGGQKYHTGSWQSGGATYYSLLVHIPSTQVVLELQGASCSKCSPAPLAGRPADSYLHPPTLALAARRLNASADELEPTKISRAVRSVAEVKAFYKAVFQVDPKSESTASDGTKTLLIQVLDTASVLLQFVERPGQTGAYNSQWFASYLNTTNIKYMGTGGEHHGCWPIWGDNHCALDQREVDIGTFYDRWSKSGYPLWMHNTPMGQPHMYAQDPSGWQMQFDGSYSNPPSGVWPKAEGNCYVCCNP